MCADGTIVIHHNAIPVLKNAEACMMPKESSVGDPDLYLETKLLRVQLESGVWTWSNSNSLSKCAQEAVRVCLQLLKENFVKICKLFLSSADRTVETDGGAG